MTIGMSTQHDRASVEAVWNTRLADLLTKHGVPARPEVPDDSGVPDLVIKSGDYRIVGECRFVPVKGDAKTAQLEKDAKRRLAVNADSDAAFALAYPDSLRRSATANALASAILHFRFFSRTQNTDWQSGQVDDFIKELAQAPALLSAEDKIAEAGDQLHAAISDFSGALGSGAQAALRDFLSASARDSGGLAGLVITNAMLLQERIAGSPYEPSNGGDSLRVRTLQECADAASNGGVASELTQEWTAIRDLINYVPIYDLALGILAKIPRSPRGTRALAALLECAQKLAADPAARRHDLMGRVYHYLLEHKKSLATYYTSVPAATLLAGLSVGLIGGEFSRARLRDFRIADFACGTGTLLMAARNEIRLRYNKYLAESGKDPAAPTARKALARTLIHDVIYGMDVLKSAVHLTAATLTMQASEARYDYTNLQYMPLGVYEDEPFLGSLELLDRKSARLFGEQAERIDALKIVKSAMTQMPQNNFDLIIMNPPFSRNTSAGGRFDQFNAQEARSLAKRLTKLSYDRGIDGKAGHGSAFVALAEKEVKADGRIAFLLPKGLATGESWAKTRNLLARKFVLEAVITNSDSADTSFSEDTKFSELMFVARKRNETETNDAATTLFINLWKRPATPQEALFFARECNELCTRVQRGESGHIRKHGSQKFFGSWACLPLPKAGETWTAAQFRDPATALGALQNLGDGGVPLCALDKLGKFGPHHLCDSNFGKFYREDESGNYPILFNYDHRLMPSLQTAPNRRVGARINEAEARQIWDAAAGTLHLQVKGVNSGTAKTLGVATDRTCLSHPWISFKSHHGEKQERAIHLWLNSSAGILSWFSGVIARGNKVMTRSKTSWRTMLVLDIRKVPAATINRLDEFWRANCRRSLKPLGALAADPLRQEIDETLAAALGVDISLFADARTALANEPDFAVGDGGDSAEEN